MAMNEALAIGIPLVITDTVRFDEVQTAGAGRVVPWDAAHVARAVAEVLTCPADAERMRIAGRRLAAERLAWPRVAETMVRAYAELLVSWGRGRTRGCRVGTGPRHPSAVHPSPEKGGPVP
jgi:glycosyltransferase involved in cell wall biosynthesis